ncbi:hypothetical protein VTO42DRAFT_744 [Malbranchea cinnamomea]
MWGVAPETPVLNNFLASIAELVQTRDGAKLQDFLQLEPPLPPIYDQMIAELRQSYPLGNSAKDAELLEKCEKLVPRTEDGPHWNAFPPFMRLYLTFLRDVNVENLLETYNLLKALLNQCVVALGDSQMGVIMLPSALYLSKVLAKLAIGLDRRPELIAHLLRDSMDEEGAIEKVTLVEKSANVVREAFIKCLTDRSGTPGLHGKPEGKRVGIYLMANLCLKLLFKCGKLRNAEQMFASISAQSPPLAYFPASQRVTYLYYLGRYLFSNNLFFPAQTALQESYNQCHRQALSQRRLILTYLIPCNIILGRFPSKLLLERPEAQGLGEKFIPLCQMIAKGDLFGFREYLAVDSPTAEWFAQKGILLQLRNRCEPLVWRSLARKVFILGGFHGDFVNQAQRGPPPFLHIYKLEAAVKLLESRAQNLSQPPLTVGNVLGLPMQQTTTSLKTPVSVDRDFVREDMGTADSEFDDYFKPEGYFDGQGEWAQVTGPDTLPDEPLEEIPDINDQSYDELFSLNSVEVEDGADEPSERLRNIESILASLLNQDLMRGYLTHKNPRYAIPGARIKGILPTGFPNVWQTIYARESQDDHVPGWVKPLPAANPFTGATAAGGGRIVNLSGARPVGALG